MASPNGESLLQTQHSEMAPPAITNEVLKVAYPLNQYSNHQSKFNNLWCMLMCGLKNLTSLLVYFTFIMILIVILVSLFTDLTVGEIAGSCWHNVSKWSWLSSSNEFDDDMIYSLNELNIDTLKKYNAIFMEMIKNLNNTTGMTYVSSNPIDLGKTSTLEEITNTKIKFDKILEQINTDNKNYTDSIIDLQLNTANKIIDKSFQENYTKLSGVSINLIKQRNDATTSSFMNNSDVQQLSTSLDVNYGMAASGITQGDIADQQQYLSNPDNVAAFSSTMVQSEISNQNDAYNSPVKYMGLRPMKPYASKWSGAGFGVQEPSEERISDESLLQKANYTL